ncbi:hypothetical protein A3F07_01385 [candidate division WWE3 bacterium RIFCSPHIGHO2_12_FULL_38_15]|uniref:Uncharacterized protein n=1 Tax=candidate division WWE3 bacterium RIFCSPHIGHO2_02_FULL_38_14 TaxID=1802620 RepID=A0A1F4VAI8_UNCKA|nr:MAG: hypothetical protein A2793_01910 [candidate division WWE3 bacterium RIFCSPHIGHO2_01_FULL_38_45]OGC48359.1 MAG: hypothetical protein A3F07_01385 [candidate division WWE3 bacterium RIFCSPHIGHO2_12_FULL_38_15]OGC53663.1 MAG: hypothetical protein A3D91_04465 [candidate division WWE3 bacterium RIFCSPHIGHO2_02_FULL_38_14]OGC54294.1 MAG: hypothetical protein A3B64_02185 [candidate division WWE3 bacterium RIFCSPLOWO2_01_FULL_37_24]HLB51538.1 methyltransferase domain-containing protein [Patescib
MKVISGKTLKDLNDSEIKRILGAYRKVEIDLGTGDGRYVYKNANENIETLFIGVEPIQKQVENYSRKSQKEKLSNAMFVLGSIEYFPEELIGTADKLTVILPWGSLLQSITNPNYEKTPLISTILKSGGICEIVLGYSQEHEPTETERLDLQNLSEEYLKSAVIPIFEKNKLHLTEIKSLNKNDLKLIETTWSKKLSYGKDRPLYLLKFKKMLN